LNANPLWWEDAGFIALVGGLQRDRAAFASKPFQGGFLAVDEGYDDGPVFGRVGAFDNHRIAVENSGIDHRITLDFQSVMVTLSEQRGRYVHIVVVIAQGFDRCSCGNPSIKRQRQRLGIVAGRGRRIKGAGIAA
jgi:hypothetical protein